MSEDTPRSYTSPRDDRFYTPRTIARSNSASNSDEWTSPRDYVTPRTYLDTDRKDSGRLPLSQRSNGSHGSYGSKDSGGNNETAYAMQAKHYYASSYDGYYQSYQHAEAQAKRPPSGYRSAPMEKPQAATSSTADHEEAIPPHISEQDIEDVFRFARHGRVEEIERLLGQGVPVDVRDSYGNTLLITACQNGNKRVAKTVLRRGANINARNYKGNTPLHYCYHCRSPCPSLPPP